MGGQDASPGQFPYQISLRSRGNRHFCGGSILTGKWVISAAHCTAGRTPNDVIVAVGSIWILGGDSYDVDKIISHENYDSFLIVNDITLLRTAIRLAFSEHVQPIAIAPNFVDTPQSAVASGFGLLSHPGVLPENLQFLETKTLTVEYCAEVLANHEIRRTSICILTRAKEGLCMGDSGGPLVVNNTLIGLVSWGFPCARGRPDVLTRVSEFYDWIKPKIDE